MFRLSLLFLIFLTFMVSSLHADDTVEAAATSNIVFEKAPELIMQDETLIIQKSAGKNLQEEKVSMDVDFHFKNISNHDVTRKIAFVLPPVQCRMDINSLWGGLDSTSRNDPQNNALKDFTTIVDNKPISFTTRKEAMLGQRNITDLLLKLKVPLNPCKLQLTSEGKPDPKYALNLMKYHLLTQENEAVWSENIYFEWMQTFPAGKTISIHHHYTPVIGESVLSPRSLQDINSDFSTYSTNLIWNRNLESLSTSNPSVVSTNNELDQATHQKRYCIMPKWVKYHLTTGANWNNGIGSLKLIIKNEESSSPFAVNEFYKTENGVFISKNANTMTFEIKNFIPTQDLFVLFLSLPKTTEELHACGL